MAKNESIENGSINLGEIGTIRNILMGDQMSEYEMKFRGLEAELAELKAELARQIETQSKQSNSDIRSLSEKMTSEIATLTQKMDENKSSLEAKIEATDEAQRQHLGQLFVELGQKMLKA